MAAQLCQHPSRTTEVGGYGLSGLEAHAPLPQDVTKEPARQVSRPLRYPRIVQTGPEEAMRQSEGVHDVVRAPATSAQEVVPVEIFWARLDRRPDVTKPQWTRGTMPQQVQAEQAEMILRTRDPHRHSIESHLLCAGVNLLRAAIVQLGESPMQVHGSREGMGIREHGLR